MNDNKKIIIMNEGIDYYVKDKHDCAEAILEEYNRFDVSMSEILASVETRGFSAEDVVDIYAACVGKSDNDTMLRIFDEVDEDDINKAFDSSLILGFNCL